jgi:hypothetical protein
VFCVPDKRRIIRELENDKFNHYMSETEASAQIHVFSHEEFTCNRKKTYIVHINRFSKYLDFGSLVL